LEPIESLPELLAVNVESGCAGRVCVECHKYFECVLPKKIPLPLLGRNSQVRERMAHVGRKIAVMSGKGGVGKSTVAANLAVALAEKGFRTGIVDSDFHGPSIPKILGVGKQKILINSLGIIPATSPLGVQVISTAFFYDQGEPIYWFHDLKKMALDEFLAHVHFGELDYLVIDLPPGTGSETVNVLKCLPDLDGAVLVTIPSEVSQGVVLRGIAHLNSARVPILGVIENMAGFRCQNCSHLIHIFQEGGGEKLARNANVRFLGRIPLEEKVSSRSDQGLPFVTADPNSAASSAFRHVVDQVHELVKNDGSPVRAPSPIAMPKAKPKKDPGFTAQLLKINYEIGSNCDFDCKNCYRFFICKLPERQEFFKRGRYGKIQEKMATIPFKIAVLSGKGGVGKSTVTANLAIAFAQKGFKTAVLDSDFYGPSIPKILGVKEKRLRLSSHGILPAAGPLGIRVLSTAFLMDQSGYFTWFDDSKREVLEGFLADVDFGDTELLLVDLPPGTGAETMNVMRFLPDLDGVVAVTIPSEVSQGVAKRGVANVQMAHVRTLGLVENMDGLVCPECGAESHLFHQGGGRTLAQEMNIPYLGGIPMDERVSRTSDEGIPFLIQHPGSSSSLAFMRVVEEIQKKVGMVPTLSAPAQ
jgi:ATP-binding protein involved in chromosome partitioning